MKIIARIQNDFSSKFGIPRQSGLAPSALSRIVFEPEYRSADALRGLEDFSHLWLIWEFSEAKREEWSPARRVWAAIPAWGCSPPVPPSGPTLSVCPA